MNRTFKYLILSLPVLSLVTIAPAAAPVPSYVYDLASAAPTRPMITLTNPSAAMFDEFGIAVAISGTRVVVGTEGGDIGAANAGSAYVFDLLSATPTVPMQTLTNPVSIPATTNTRFYRLFQP